jgi:hypothetical protein
MKQIGLLEEKRRVSGTLIEREGGEERILAKDKKSCF